MPQRAKPISNLHQFLTENVSATDGDSIKEAKRLYWNRKKALWRQEQRKNTKTITVSFSKREYASITSLAKRHHRSRTGYVKTAALAYGKGAYVQLTPNAVNVLREAYLLNYYALHDLQDELVLSSDVATIVRQKMEELYSTIQSELYHPKRVETVIQELIREQPEYRQILVDLINTI